MDDTTKGQERKKVQAILSLSYSKKFNAVVQDKGEKEAVIVREAIKEYLDRHPPKNNNRY